MSLPWIRLDSNIGTHDKIAELMADKDGPRAFALYVSSLGWCGGHGTDGFIPKHALPNLCPPARVTEKHTRLLVDVRLWEYVEGGWKIRNYEIRQELSTISEMKREAHRKGARRTNCQRYHGPDCGCWKKEENR